MKTIFIILCLTLFVASNLVHASAPHYDTYEPTAPISYEGDVLHFYSVKTAYGEFSNFALFPIVIDGVPWPTSEHYYQAHKYTDLELQEKVRAASTPMKAALIGRDPAFPKRTDWDSYKEVAMEVAVRAKIEQHPSLKILLHSTNQSILVERTINDCYWGDCGDGTGLNRLGILLMKLRDEL